MRRTKIVATLGPASNTPEMVMQLLKAGVDVVRLNFSHGTHDDHAKSIRIVRQAAKELNRPVAILQDLQGPKIRTGPLMAGQPVTLVPGTIFTITTKPIVGDALMVSTSYTPLPNDVEPGDRILVSDGLIELQVIETTGDSVTTQIVHGGELREHQGINLPGVKVSSPAVTEKDIEDLKFGLANGVDYVAISFVRRAADVQQVLDLISEAGYDTPVIAKIEKPEALDELDAILEKVNGVMVARGDLGVEMALEQVPLVQKRIIAAANAVGVPVITATQMLESMIVNPRPTRAEAGDIANAIIDGTDAVMLSGETAKGAFPVEAVRVMSMIAEATDSTARSYDFEAGKSGALADFSGPANAIGEAASAVVNTLSVRAIVAFTQSGGTARLMAHHRPRVPIIAITPYEHIYRRLNLLWGVIPTLGEMSDHQANFEAQTMRCVIDSELAQPKDYVVMTGGHPIAHHGQTNFLKILQIANPEL